MRKFGAEHGLSENPTDFHEAPAAFLRPMGLAGRNDLKLVGLHRFFPGASGRQEVGFIAATRNDGRAVGLTVYATGPIIGNATAYAALMSPLNLLSDSELTSGYVKALAAMPKAPFEGEFAGYRVTAHQRGDGADLLSEITVAPLVAPPAGDPLLETAQPSGPPHENPCMQRCRSRCLDKATQCISKYGEQACQPISKAIKTQCLPACREACMG